jgi:Protein of unknown function (DUF2726).
MDLIFCIFGFAVLMATIALLVAIIRLIIPKANTPYNRTRSLFPTEPDFPYTRARLFSPTEEDFFFALLYATKNQYFVFPKVRLGDILDIQHGISPQRRNHAFNLIKAKHIDFIIINRDTLKIEWAIELDDSSHDRPDRRWRDDFVNTALGTADIKIQHFKARMAYNAEEIAKVLFNQ